MNSSITFKSLRMNTQASLKSFGAHQRKGAYLLRVSARVQIMIHVIAGLSALRRTATHIVQLSLSPWGLPRGLD